MVPVWKSALKTALISVSAVILAATSLLGIVIEELIPFNRCDRWTKVWKRHLLIAPLKWRPRLYGTHCWTVYVTRLILTVKFKSSLKTFFLKLNLQLGLVLSKREELSKDRLSLNYLLFVFDQANDLKRFTNTWRDVKAPNEDKVASINIYLKHTNKFTKYILRKKSSIIILPFNRS